MKEKAAAHEFNDAAPMFGEYWDDLFLAVSVLGGACAQFVDTHAPAVADSIRT